MFVLRNYLIDKVLGEFCLQILLGNFFHIPCFRRIEAKIAIRKTYIGKDFERLITRCCGGCSLKVVLSKNKNLIKSMVYVLGDNCLLLIIWNYVKFMVIRKTYIGWIPPYQKFKGKFFTFPLFLFLNWGILGKALLVLFGDNWKYFWEFGNFGDCAVKKEGGSGGEMVPQTARLAGFFENNREEIRNKEVIYETTY